MKNKKLLCVFSIPVLSFLISSGLTNKNASFNNIAIKNKSYIVLFDSETKKNEFNLLTSSIKEYFDITDEFKGLTSGYLIKTSENVSSYFKGLSCVSHINEDKAIFETSSTFYDSTKVFTNELENNSKEDMDVPTISKEGEGVFVAVLDTSFSLKHNAFQDLDDSIDKKVSKDDITSLVESGSLNIKSTKDYYYNSKVPFYHDYGGSKDYKYDSSKKEYYYTNVIEEDDDTETIHSEHGMHVASIATGNGKVYKGIASASQLAFMKVSSLVNEYNTKGELSSTSEALLDSNYLKALNDCYTLNVDVVNMSFGGALNEFNDSATAIAIKKLEENGVTVAAAAGNDGKGNFSSYGSYAYSTTSFVNSGTIGTMGNYEGVTSVASNTLKDDTNASPIVYFNDEEIKVYDEILTSRGGGTSDTGTYAYPPNMPFVSLIDDNNTSKTLEYVVVPNLGKTEDYASIDVKGKIALVERGEINFQEKIKNAKNNGAIGVIMGNSEDSVFGMGFDSGDESLFVPTIAVTSSTFKKLKEASKKEITIYKDVVSDFSSEGTNDSLEIVNDISAPGSNIAGAINVNDNKMSYDTYAYLSGTSMASPNYSGAVALILGEQDFESESQEKEYKSTLKNRIMSTANVLFNETGAPVSVRKQGAGEIDVDKAINSNIYLTSESSDGSKVELKNNDNIKDGNINFDVTINNTKKESGSYKATLYVTRNDTITYKEEGSSFDGITLTKDKSILIDKVELDEITLTKEEKQTFNVSYSLKEDDKKEIDELFKKGTFIEGYVVLESESSSLSDLSIPYMGYYNDYDKVDCVEPFDFEKEEGVTYESDLVNDVCKNRLNTNYAKPNANFSSLIGVTKGGSSITGISDILENKKDPYDLYDKPITYIDNEGIRHIKCGVKNMSDTLYIQQFVNRSVKDNTLTFINEKGETVLTDHMFDALYGESDEGTHPLYKSVATTSLISNGYIAHRAYTILALKDKKNGTFYEDGTYTMKIVYEFEDGESQTLIYKLDIGNEKEDVSVTSAKIEDNTLSINGNISGVNGLSSSYYSLSSNTLSIDLAKIDEKEITYFTILSSSYEKLNCFFDPTTKTILLSTSLTDSVTYSVTSETKNNKTTYKLSVINAKGKEISLGKDGAKFVIVGDSENESQIIELAQNDKTFTPNSSDGLSVTSASLIAAGCVLGVALIVGGCFVAKIIIKKKKTKTIE